MIGKIRGLALIVKAVLLAPFSRYYRNRLDLVLHGVPFPQNDAEFRWLCHKVGARDAGSYMEVGSRHGGSLLMLSHYLRSGAKLVCIDLPNAEWGMYGSEVCLHNVAALLRKRGFEVTCVLGDSHAESTLAQAKDACGHKAVDILLLDGDHTYAGVRQDWEMYGPFVCPGGMVVFHDLIMPPHNPRVQVGQLFDELKGRHPAESMTRLWGLGLVYV